MLERLGRWSHDRRVPVVIVWLVALVGLGATVGAVGGGFKSQFSLPNVESARGFDIINAKFGGKGGGTGGTLVFKAEQGVNDPQVQQEMQAWFDQVAKDPAVEDVVSPYSPQGAFQVAQQGASANKIAYARVEVPDDITQTQGADLKSRIEKIQPHIDGVQIEYGGQLFGDFQPPNSETLGLAFAIFILILAFGSVLAMGLPVSTALAGIAGGTMIVTLLSNVIEMPDFTTTLGVMIGLGVGIDYALFIVTRYREGMHEGMASSEATGKALDTAGRAVLFAGTTVVISLLGMLLMGVDFVRGLAIGAAITVFITMIASITLLPALLGFVQNRVEVTRWRGIIAASLVALALVGVGLKINALMIALPLAVIVVILGFFVPALKKQVPHRKPVPAERTLPYRWSRLIQERPWPAVIIGTLVLVLLAVPFFSLRLGFSDDGNSPKSTTTRKAYDILAEGFGPGFNGPLVLVADMGTKTAEQTNAVAQQATAAVQADPGVAVVRGPIPNDPAKPTAVQWLVIPKTAPQDAATTQLVNRLRHDVLPKATEGTGVKVLVTGSVAVNADFTDYLSARLPLFFGVVLLLSFVLLMTVFRSILVPLKAVVMNLLSIGAAFGIVVLIFQWGWFGSLLGLQTGPIEPFVPMMLFAIVFGLSMDYEVFLLSRIREEWDHTHDNAKAVADGLAKTARVITAAAAIMVFVFGSFLLESERVIKLFGIGLASAVLLDATIVRLLLVPATMELLGDRNWWLPKWLDRILPRINVEGARHDDVIDLPGEEGEEELVGAGRD
jgi:putative drug exporter of the RND superfamily